MFTFGTVVPILLAIYVLFVAIFIILENRSPQSTFAWLLLLIFLPFGGIPIYLFFGRSWHAFSRETKLARQAGGSHLTDSLVPLLDRQQAIIAVERPESYNNKLLKFIASNRTSSLMTEYNEVEILQDAAAKYPRLLEDLRRAKHFIHRDFMRDIGRCRKFDLGAYHEQPITSRLVDSVYRLASPLL